jgi:predicted transcriptional regulator
MSDLQNQKRHIHKIGGWAMQRSKLEINVDVLKALARHGPLKLTHIRRKANVDCNGLPQFLGFLIQHNLVEQQTLHETRLVYAITERGLRTLNNFMEQNKALPIIEDSHKILALLY